MSKNKYSKITKYKLLKIIKQIYADNNIVFKGTPYTSKRCAITLLIRLDIHTYLIKKYPAWHSDTMFNHYVSIGCITNKNRLLKLPKEILDNFFMHCIQSVWHTIFKMLKKPYLLEFISKTLKMEINKFSIYSQKKFYQSLFFT